MSSANRIANVGASARASDAQATSDIASFADDRAVEILVTPGAAQKKIMPLSEESTTLNPRLLIVGKDTDATIANGVVAVRPGYFEAGVSGDPNTIGLAGKLDAKLASGAFGANSSGSTRTDLLYATLSYGATVTASVRQKPTAGGAPVSATLPIENDITITLGIVPGVSSATPLASLPADSGSGKTAVYNFGLAAVSIANGFSGGAINQASIAPLWSGGWIQPHRVHGLRPMSIYASSAAEKPSTPLTERWGSLLQFIGTVKLQTGSSTITLDTTIDWRKRVIWGFIFAASGNPSNAPEVVTNAIYTNTNMIQLLPNFTGSNAGLIYQETFTGRGASGANLVFTLIADNVTNGNLLLSVTNPVNNDYWNVVLFATDQFLATV